MQSRWHEKQAWEAESTPLCKPAFCHLRYPSPDESIAKLSLQSKNIWKKGDEIVNQNYKAVDMTVQNLFKVVVPQKAASNIVLSSSVTDHAPTLLNK